MAFWASPWLSVLHNSRRYNYRIPWVVSLKKCNSGNPGALAFKTSNTKKHIKKQRYYFVNKVLSSQGYGFSSGHVWMWELDCEESWVPKNWCFWSVVLEKTPESPLDRKEIQPAHSKGDQSWVFIGRTLAKAETPILWPPHVKGWLIWKDPDAGRDLGAGEEGDDRGWDGWMASPPWWMWVWVDSRSWCWTGRPGMLRFMGSQKSDTTEQLNWTEQVLSLFLRI